MASYMINLLIFQDKGLAMDVELSYYISPGPDVWELYPEVILVVVGTILILQIQLEALKLEI